MARTVLLIGAFDSKCEEYNFVRRRLQASGLETLTLNWGVLGGCDHFPVDIESAHVAAAGGADLEALRKAGDQEAAVATMAQGGVAVVPGLYREGRFDGVFALGKARGTSVAAAAMRALPIGVPKVIVSTLAGSDTSAFLGAKDINIFPSLVDVSGLNAVSRTIMAQAAAALAGMVAAEPVPETDTKPIIAMSMFGQTRPCVERCKEALSATGYDVLTFHATGMSNVKQFELDLEFDPRHAFDLAPARFVGTAPFVAPGAGVQPLSGRLKVGAASFTGATEGDAVLGTLTLRTSETVTVLVQAHIRVALFSIGPSSTNREDYEGDDLNMGIVLNKR